MAGGLIDRAKKDAAKIVASGEFSLPMVLETPDSSETLSLNGLYTNHNTDYDSDSLPVNAQSVHVTLSESDLIEGSYPYKNDSGDIFLNEHLVTVTVSQSESLLFKIKEIRPDKTLNLIVCYLYSYERNS